MGASRRDTLAAVGLLVLGLALLPVNIRLGINFGAAIGIDAQHPIWLRVLTLLIGVTATRFRSTRPALTLPLALTAFALDITSGGSLVIVMVITDGCYAVARYGTPKLARAQLWFIGSGIALFASSQLLSRAPLEDLLLGVLLLGVFFLLPIWWGTSLRLERDRTELERELGVGRLELLRSEQREHTRAALAADRAATGAELHDLVANQLAAIALRAEAAELGQSAGRPVHSADLAAITAASRSALRHLHELIGLLREEDTAGELSADSLAGVLVHARALGAPVRWVGGDDDADGFAEGLRRLEESERRELLRILSEALANAARHGAGAAEGAGGVALRWSAGERRLTVTNAMRESGVVSAGAGIGQRTMTERARRIGARINFGPEGSGGSATWVVAITLPPAHESPLTPTRRSTT